MAKKVLLSINDNLYQRINSLIKKNLFFKNVSAFIRQAIENEVIKNEITSNESFSFKKSPVKGLWIDINKNSVDLTKELRKKK